MPLILGSSVPYLGLWSRSPVHPLFDAVDFIHHVKYSCLHLSVSEDSLLTVTRFSQIRMFLIIGVVMFVVCVVNCQLFFNF